MCHMQEQGTALFLQAGRMNISLFKLLVSVLAMAYGDIALLHMWTYRGGRVIAVGYHH